MSKYILFLSFISAFIRFPCLLGDFVFDDKVAIVNNKDVFNISESWIKVFEHDFWGYNLTSTSHKSYRPFTILTFRWNGLVSTQAFGFHAVNIIFHVLNCNFVLKILKCYFNIKIATIASLIFAVHPCHTEAVCGVVGRADILWSFMALISIYLRKLFKNLVEGEMKIFFAFGEPFNS